MVRGNAPRHLCILADFEKERDEGDLGVLLLNEFGIMATNVLCVETAGSESRSCVGSKSLGFGGDEEKKWIETGVVLNVIPRVVRVVLV